MHLGGGSARRSLAACITLLRFGGAFRLAEHTYKNIAGCCSVGLNEPIFYRFVVIRMTYGLYSFCR
jgi:hypothetical protein